MVRRELGNLLFRRKIENRRKIFVWKNGTDRNSRLLQTSKKWLKMKNRPVIMLL